jgi:hypothetical protein
VEESILKSVKKVLGISADYDVFDNDIILHTNSALSTLYQLGIGPATGFQIEGDDEEWEDFLGADPRLNSVKTYVCLKVRLAFDPPGTSFAITAMEKQIEELAWRINVTREESTPWSPPVTTPSILP